jgi:hypothetical protein
MRSLVTKAGRWRPGHASGLRRRLQPLARVCRYLAGRTAPLPPPPALDRWPHLPIVLAAVVVGYAAARAAWPALEWPTVSAELVAGVTTFDGTDKQRDFRAIRVFLATAVAAALLLRGVGRGLARYRGNDTWAGYGAILWVALIPALYRLGLSLTSGAPPGPVGETCAALAVVLGVAVGLWRWRADLTGRELSAAGGATLCAAAVGALGAAGLLTAWYRLVPASFAPLDAEHARGWLVWGARVGLGGAALLVLTARDAPTLCRRLCAWVITLQAGLPLLLAVLLPSPIASDSGIAAGRYRPALLALLALAVVGCVGSLWRRYRSLRRSGGWSLGGALSPWCVAAAAVFFATTPVGIPRLNADDFHHGEWTVPVQQWRDFGKVPYRDFTPIFGSALGVGAADRVFYSGTLETWEQSWVLLHGAAAGLLFLAVWWHAGPWVACLVGLLGETAITVHNLLWLPALLVLAHPTLLGAPRRWLAVWLALGPVLALYNPSYGCSAVLATAPVAAVMAWRLGRTDRRGLARLAGAVAAAGAFVLLVPPLRGAAVGYVRFVLNQAAVNDVAWGIPWELSYGKPGSHGIFASPAGYLAWEVLRFGWLPITVVLAWRAWDELRRPRAERDASRLALSFTTAAAVLLLSGYLAGRIDPGGLWRSGMLTLLLLQVWLPLELLRGRGRRTAVVAAALLAVLFGALRLWPRTEPTAASVAARVAHLRSVRAADLGGLVPVDSNTLHCRRLGRVYADPNHLSLLLAFRTEIDRLLGPGETFLNLTIHNAWYYYADRPVPTHFSSPTYASAATDQLRMVADFRTAAPPVVVLRPSPDLDGIPASLRCYRLFREVALRYVPIRRPPFVFLVDPSRASPADPTDLAARVAILEEAYPERNLARLPEVWGASWDRLRHRFVEAAALDGRRAPDGPTTTFDLGGLVVSGADADFLRLAIDWEPAPGREKSSQVALRVEFAPADRPAAWRLAARCQSRAGGTLLVPLGSSPAWLLAPRVGRVRVTLENPDGSAAFAVREARLLRLAEGK